MNDAPSAARAAFEPQRPSGRPVTSPAALAQELRPALSGEVRFDDGTRALYATGGSNYRQIPIGVVIPRDEEDILRTVGICRRHGAPILSRGGGTSLAGQCCNVAVILDMSKYCNRILEIDPAGRRARVEPGVILDTLRDAAEQYHLTFAPDPSTHSHCTLGGMIGNNSCGVHSVMGGKTVDNVEELDVLTYDGLRLRVGATSDEEFERIVREGGRRAEIYAGMRALRDRYAELIRRRFPRIPRRVSGYNLDELLPEHGFHVARALVGSEGTLVTILSATCRLVHSPPARSLLVLGYPDVFSAGDHVPEVLSFEPIGLEGIDDRLISDMKKKGLHPEDIVLVPPGGGWLMVEFGGADREESDGKAKQLMEALSRRPDPPSMKLFDDPVHEKMLWQIRESGLGATANVPGSRLTWEGWEDSAVPPDRLGGYLRDFRALLDRYGYACDLYGHFGQGCVHTRIDFDLETAAGIRAYRAFIDEAADLVVRYGGSLSGEHGDGQSRAALLPKMFGPELIQAFREFKRIWDPEGRMNPGKVVDPYEPTDNLRLGTNYNPWIPETHFHYPDDRNSFAQVGLRCVGVGECRRLGGGTMCPSFMATREEMHSTRGRARLLFEMMEGDAIPATWRNETVREALDLCLACKGCKGECPVNVDMATYKAEFLSHYYEGRLRPLAAYSMGLIPWWARLGARMPALANALTRHDFPARVMKRLGGIAPERRIPSFAAETFTTRFRRMNRHHHPEKPRILLWPDTFNNHFFPGVLEAAAGVLVNLGYNPVLPGRPLCCGRPLYDFGMLGLAKRQLRQILDELREEIRSGVPVVGLEPSCVSVFRDELGNLFPADEDAKRLRSQTWLLSEFLDRENAPLPPLHGRALVHGHCHQKAVLDRGAQERVLRRMGLELEIPEPGCCGMAGAFGFERDKYEISVRIGERALLPAVRSSPEETLIVADGFSCREQITQCSRRRPLHLAEVLSLALGGGLSLRGARSGPMSRIR